MRAWLSSSLLLLAACSSSSTQNNGSTDGADAGPTETPPDAGGLAETSVPDSGPPLTGECASSFGNALTVGFGRLDGVIYSVQKPSDTQCVMPNSDHLILQVRMAGAVYRMVANVQSDQGSDTQVRYQKLSHALPAPAWIEGWHAAAPLDYATSLDVHSTAGFTPFDLDTLVTNMASELHVGDPVSVYATVGSGRTESAHLIHRNHTNEDGAIVVQPTFASPKFLLFHFADQTF